MLFRFNPFDLTHAPVATAARAAATGLVSMSTGPDPEGSEHLEAASPETKNGLFFLILTVNAYLLLTFEGLIGRDTFSVLAPVLGPSQKNWLCHPLPLFMAVSMIPNT